ncbi:hypothetical protein [Streptomyces anulatus]|uniref:hypothetical protein n=1 Tax=Streptomyces anulatus TaxID=1892 RepID=UPI003424E61A
MTIRTLALASATTSLQDHRLALGAFMAPGASVLERRGGVYYYPGAADLTSAAALQANVAPFVAIVDGTSNSLQGQYTIVSDAAVTLTFSAGEPAVARTDRVIIQMRDTTYDASGSTDARVLVLKGNTSTGAATALPASSLLLWEVTVPIGASSITFSSARTDKRTWTSTPMRIPVNSQAERDALPTIPGLEVTRLDTGDVQQYWSSAWRTIGGTPQTTVQYVVKSADTTRTSTITATDDPHLVLPVLANSVYLIELFIHYRFTTTADMRIGLNVPSGATWKMVPGSIDWNGPNGNAGIGNYGLFGKPTTTTEGLEMFMGGAAGNYTGAVPKGILRTGGTAGNCTVTWAQVSSEATNSIVYADSYMRLEKIA